MDEVFGFLARAIAELVIEILIRGPGWMIVRLFREPEAIDADGLLVLVVGILFWVAVAFSIWGISFLF